jgi:predicted RNA polymerase sigma factor
VLPYNIPCHHRACGLAACLKALAEIERAGQTYTDSHQEILRAVMLEQLGKNREASAVYRHAVWMAPTLTSTKDDIERLVKTRSQQTQ